MAAFTVFIMSDWSRVIHQQRRSEQSALVGDCRGFTSDQSSHAVSNQGQCQQCAERLALFGSG